MSSVLSSPLTVSVIKHQRQPPTVTYCWALEQRSWKKLVTTLSGLWSGFSLCLPVCRLVDSIVTITWPAIYRCYERWKRWLQRLTEGVIWREGREQLIISLFSTVMDRSRPCQNPEGWSYDVSFPAVCLNHVHC